MRAAARERFGALLADQLRRSHPQTAEETLQRERLKAFRAPLIVVVAAHCDPKVKITFDARSAGEVRSAANFLKARIPATSIVREE